jgi:hypothetical protein
MSNNFYQLAKVNSNPVNKNLTNIKQSQLYQQYDNQIIKQTQNTYDDDEDEKINNEEDYDTDNIFSDNNEEFILFKKNVREWLLIDDDIMKLQNAIKDRRKKKNDLTPKIMSFMNNYQINDLNTQNGKLKFSKTQHTKPINKQFLMAKISDYFKDMNKGEKIANYILDNRDKEERMNLRRIKDKKKEFSL